MTIIIKYVKVLIFCNHLQYTFIYSELLFYHLKLYSVLLLVGSVISFNNVLTEKKCFLKLTYFSQLRNIPVKF